MKQYPQCLADSLAAYGVKPTGNYEWDRELLHLCKNRDNDSLRNISALSSIVKQSVQQQNAARQAMPDLSDPAVYNAHVRLLMYVANDIVLAPQRRQFQIDDNNRKVLRFLLLYFNESPMAEEVFPDQRYRLHKNIMLRGGVGTGKTIMMQIFSEYLRLTKNPRYFHNVSVTQMVNHYTIHNNIDLYTYNEKNSVGFRIDPQNLCLNDIGVDNRPFYGVDTLTVVNDFLHARNELWANLGVTDRRFAHLTTNLDKPLLAKLFRQRDAYGRIIDRFKTYNIIELHGESRR